MENQQFLFQHTTRAGVTRGLLSLLIGSLVAVGVVQIGFGVKVAIEAESLWPIYGGLVSGLPLIGIGVVIAQLRIRAAHGIAKSGAPVSEAA